MRRSLILVIGFIGLGFFASCSKEVQKVEVVSQMTYEDSLMAAEKYVAKGIDFQKEKKFKDAIGQFTKALEYIPNDAEVHNFIGIAWHRMGDYDKAIEHFNDAKALNSNYVDAINNLGYMFFLQKSAAQ